MGRRPKRLSADPLPNQIPSFASIAQSGATVTNFGGTSKVLFLPMATSAASSTSVFNKLINDSPSELACSSQFTDSQPTKMTASVSKTSLSKEKILLPKLPPGVRAPAKVILISSKDPSEPPQVQVLNTGLRPRLAMEEHKKKVMTGELGKAKTLLPKPDDTLRDAQRLIMTSFMPAPKNNIPAPMASAPATMPSFFSSGLPINSRESTPPSEIRGLHIIRDDTDAVDGFEDLEDAFSQPLMEEETIEQDSEVMGFPQLITALPHAFQAQMSSTQGGRIILPKPTSKEDNIAGMVPFSLNLENGWSSTTQMLLSSLVDMTVEKPNPDDFRPPKRRKAEPRRAVDLDECPPVDTSIEDLLNQRKRKGRPTTLKKKAATLILEQDSECLGIASDGINLKCIPCNCLLTARGVGYSRQVHKHLYGIKSHQARYELWKHQNPDPLLTTILEERKRTRGRYRKTPLNYMSEINSPWLRTSADGQTLICDACNIVLIEVDLNEGKGKRCDVIRHLTRDPVHLKNVDQLSQTVEALSQSEVGELMGAVVEKIVETDDIVEMEEANV